MAAPRRGRPGQRVWPWCGLLLCLLATAPSTRTWQADSHTLYGTWSWTETSGGFTAGPYRETPDACGCQRLLFLREDRRYEYVERDSTREYLLCSGRYEIHPVLGVTSGTGWEAHFWLKLAGWWQFGENQLVRFLAPDTVILYPGSPNTGVSDASTSWFARSAASATDSSGKRLPRLPLSQRPRGSTEAMSLPAEGEFVYYEEEPVPVTRVRPTYPEFAREKGIEGTVILHALVGKDGRVRRLKVIRGVPALNDAAVDAVKQWIFKPALSNNKPVAIWIEVPVEFPP